MKKVLLVFVATLLFACGGPPQPPIEHDGCGGALSSSSSSSSSGDADAGGLACDNDHDCSARLGPAERCWAAFCEDSACVRYPAPVGSECNSYDPSQTCDGFGVCRLVFEYGGTCHIPNTIPEHDACPVCDDDNPCTADFCSNGVCVHVPHDEGRYCAPWYTCQNSLCCPHPDTLP